MYIYIPIHCIHSFTQVLILSIIYPKPPKIGKYERHKTITNTVILKYFYLKVVQFLTTEINPQSIYSLKFSGEARSEVSHNSGATSADNPSIVAFQQLSA